MTLSPSFLRNYVKLSIINKCLESAPIVAGSLPSAFDRCQSPVGVYVGLRYTSAATRLERYLDPLGRQQRNGAP
jgi:hypothetical protein